jgi:3-phenylpropionate/trans-cinnamate dioxygenase ferredoxin subunit
MSAVGQRALSVSELGPEDAVAVELRDAAGDWVRVAIVRDSDGDFHAIGDACSHGEVSLAMGDVSGCLIECLLHGSQFDLRTGQPLQLPAVRPVPVYPLTIEDGDVFVDVDHLVAPPQL